MKTMKISMNALIITIETAEDIHCTVIPSTTSCASTLCIEKLSNSANTSTDLADRSSSSSNDLPLSECFGIRNIEINDSSVILNDAESNSSECYVSNGMAKINNNIYSSNQCLQNLSISLISKSGSKITPSICRRTQSQCVANGQGEPNLIPGNDVDLSSEQDCPLNNLDKEIVPDKAINCVDLMQNIKLERTRSEPDVSADEKKQKPQVRNSRKLRGLSSSRLEEKTVCELFDPLINFESNENDSGYSAKSQNTLTPRTLPSARNNISGKAVVNVLNGKDERNHEKAQRKFDFQNIIYTNGERRFDSDEDHNNFLQNIEIREHANISPDRDSSQIVKQKKSHSAQHKNRKDIANNNVYVRKFERKQRSKRVPAKDSLEDFNNERIKMDIAAQEIRNQTRQSKSNVNEKNTNRRTQRSSCPEEWENREHTKIVYDLEYQKRQSRERTQRSAKLSIRYRNRSEPRSRETSCDSGNGKNGTISGQTDIYYDLTDDDYNVSDCNSLDNLNAIHPFIEEYLHHDCDKNEPELKRKISLIKTDAKATLVDMFQNNIYRTSSDVQASISISQISSPDSEVTSVDSSKPSTTKKMPNLGSTLRTKATVKANKHLPAEYKLKGSSVPVAYQSCYVPRCPDSREEVGDDFMIKCRQFYDQIERHQNED